MIEDQKTIEKDEMNTFDSKETDNEENLEWILSHEFYEILDSCGLESVGFREFCALILLYSAFDSGNLTKCLYEHGPLLYDIVGGGQHIISGERLKTLGRVLGITEEYLNEVGESLDIKSSTLINYESY